MTPVTQRSESRSCNDFCCSHCTEQWLELSQKCQFGFLCLAGRCWDRWSALEHKQDCDMPLWTPPLNTGFHPKLWTENHDHSDSRERRPREKGRGASLAKDKHSLLPSELEKPQLQCGEIRDLLKPTSSHTGKCAAISNQPEASRRPLCFWSFQLRAFTAGKKTL